MKTRIHIEQMDCPTEEGMIRRKLGRMSGVGALQFNLVQRILTVEHDEHRLPEVLAAIRSLGFEPQLELPRRRRHAQPATAGGGGGHDHAHGEEHGRGHWPAAAAGDCRGAGDHGHSHSHSHGHGHGHG